MKYAFSIRHYQPEIAFLKNKRQLHLNLPASACFVVDTADHFAIRASHDPEHFFSADFFDVTEMKSVEKEAFLQALEIGARFYFRHSEQPFLVFTDWLRETGLLLVLSPDTDAIATEAALHQFATREFTFPTASSQPPSERFAWGNAFEILSGVFSLIDLVSEESLAQNSYQLLAKLAALLGCQPEDEPVRVSTVSNREIL